MEFDSIVLAHGEGGLATKRLIEKIFSPMLANEFLDKNEDAAVFDVRSLKGRMAFTTDSFIVEPIFFPGGDIGKLAVSGTVNDLAAMGAQPGFFAASFIIEEGFSTYDLSRVVKSFAENLKNAGAMMIAADTKVAPEGHGGEIFISVAAIGEIYRQQNISLDKIEVGDEVVISGDIARHFAAILAVREKIDAEPPLQSDCAPLWNIVKAAIDGGVEIHSMRDPTRGGLATTLVEISEKAKIGIEIDEEKIPIKPQVISLCDIYGFDPLYLANEGKMTFFVRRGDGEKLAGILKNFEVSRDAAVIGRVVDGDGVILNTRTGGRRKLIMLEGAQLPRIC